MIKRASTILLTLFLLLSSAQVWGATIVPDQVVGGTKFESSSSPKTIDNIKYYGEESLSLSATSAQYSFPSTGGIKFEGGINSKVFSHTVTGLPTSGSHTYTVTITTSGIKKICIKAPNDNVFTGDNISFNISSTNGSFTYEFHAWGEQDVPFTITEIKVVGDIEQKIVSENRDDLCAGEDNTFTAIGVSGNITWTLDGQPIKGAKIVGNTITFAPSEGGILKAVAGSTSLTYKFTTRFCCAVNADRTDVSIETFTFKNSGDKIERIDNGVRSNIRTEYEMAPSLGEIKEDKYAVIKSTDGTWPNWYNANNAKIVYGHTKENSDIDNATLSKFNQANGKNSSYDGFIAVNCNVNTYSKNPSKSIIFQYESGGICKNTYHDFSAFISNIDAKAGEADVNVKFLVTDGAGNKLLDRSTDDIKCGDQSWKEYGGSFETKDNENIVLTLYNNNDKAVPNSDGNIVGNDVGVDDIRFSRCVPRINVHFNTELTAFTSDECNNTNTNKTINLYIGHHDYNVAEILDGAYFIVLQNKGAGWERISGMSSGPIAFDKTHAQNMVTATITPNQGKTEYKAIIASSKDDVEKVESGNTTNLSTTCAVYNITKPNEIAVLDPVCATPCTELETPTVVAEFNTCPSSTEKDLDDLLTKEAGITYQWFEEDKETERDSKVSISTEGETIYYVKAIGDGVTTCDSDWAKVTVNVSDEPVISLVIGSEVYNDKTYTICEGSCSTTPVKLVAQLEDSSLKVKWTATPADPNTDVTATDAQFINICPNAKTVYTADIPGSCYVQSTVTIDLTSAEKPVLSTDNASICLNSPVKITDTTTETAEKYEWYVKKDNGNWESISNNSKNLESYTPSAEGKYYFKSKAINGQCEAESDEITVEVGAPITFTLSEPTTICEGSETFVYVKDIEPSTANVQWYDEDDNKIGDEDGLLSVRVAPKDDTTYKVSLWVEGGCTANASVKITVDGKIEANIIADKDICEGESITIWASGGDIKWNNGTEQVGEGESITVSPKIETKYTAQITNGVCTKDTFMTVYVHELPEIISIERVDPNDPRNSSMKANVTKGTEPYLYSLDGEEYNEIPSGIIENLPIGWNLLYVKDKYGCKTNKLFEVEPTPIIPEKYFSPNGDGVNETWNVEFLDLYPSYIVEIFDRHGRRLFIQRVGSFNTGGNNTVDGDVFTGWDGMYNGHAMPSDDYWYLITVEEIRKQYTGHFTLKR